MLQDLLDLAAATTDLTCTVSRTDAIRELDHVLLHRWARRGRSGSSQGRQREAKGQKAKEQTHTGYIGIRYVGLDRIGPRCGAT
jgi:hypothetical protein